ncbi:MAG: SUF system Fe-S cluster assembly protein [Phycisphaeraceae bacterium]
MRIPLPQPNQPDRDRQTQGDQPMPDQPAPDASVQDQIVAAIKQVYDPEIPVNIYDLGLIYEVDVKPDETVDVKMTLTTPNCPEAQTLPGMVEQAVETVAGVKKANVEIVWEPRWDKEMMSDAAKLQLGFM